ncbi:MAG: GTP cyclohydrolase I type 1, partial [uncultured Actinomycetospora sp.]
GDESGPERRRAPRRRRRRRPGGGGDRPALAGLRRPARRGRRARAAARRRRGPRPRGPARDAGPGGARLRGALRRAAQRPGRGARPHVRRGPRRAGARARHPDVLHVRAPPAALPRAGARRLHPRHRRPGHGAEQARPPRRPLRAAPAGPGAAHAPGRRRAVRAARGPRRARGDRRRAPVHVRPRGAQARRPHHDVGGARDHEDVGEHPRRGPRPDPGLL